MAAKLSGSGGGGLQAVEQNSEINVTPFVDVMLVLLIIFMVAAPLASVSVKVELPPAVAKPSQTPPKPFYISIQKDGAVYLGDRPIEVQDIGKELKKQIIRRDPSKERIYIRADQQTHYRDFLEVMNKLQDEGFYQVALIGKDDNK
ncbi:MAG: biopolymer transporter ExbD [Caulobacter sp.]|nr:biopolymer transporter ExbD [Caulobacter sp.]